MDLKPEEWLNVAEKIFNKSIGYGIAFGTISLTYYLAFTKGVISSSYSTQIAFDISQIILPVSAALIVLGFVIWIGRAIMSILAWPFAAIARFGSRRKSATKAYQNMCMLTAEARVVLLFYTRHPDGRFKSPGHVPPVRELMGIGAIKPDDEHAWSNGVSYPGELMAVDSLFMTKKMREKLDALVQADNPHIVDNNTLTQAVHSIMNRYGLVRI